MSIDAFFYKNIKNGSFDFESGNADDLSIQAALISHKCQQIETVAGFAGSIVNVKGNFVAADRKYIFSSCFTENRISCAVTVTTSGWSKEDDCHLDLFWQDISKADLVTNVDVELEQKKGNVYFISKDLAFTLKRADKAVRLWEKNGSSSLLVPLVYFANEIDIVNVINSFLNLIAKAWKMMKN